MVKTIGSVFVVVFVGCLLVLGVCSIASACQIGWDVNQPSQDQAAWNGVFSYELQTTFIPDAGQTHTVYFAAIRPLDYNIYNASITPSYYSGLDDGAHFYLLDTTNSGVLVDTDENGLFRTNAWADPGFCSGGHQCTILKP